LFSQLPEGTVTVLFTDLEGSTALARSHGDELARAMLRVHEGLVREQVNAQSGHEAKAMGDGFMVAFASTRRAVACAADGPFLIVRSAQLPTKVNRAVFEVIPRAGNNAGS
jgi:class 3 adenylate cyclase